MSSVFSISTTRRICLLLDYCSLKKEVAGGTYVDGPEAGAVASGHVGVQGIDSVGARHLTVLLVHVVGARTRVVAEPDTEVLDLLGVLLVELNLRVRSGLV